MPPSRSSNTFGSAKVVDWKTMLDTAVVKKTMAETRTSSALTSAGSTRAAAAAFTRGFGRISSGHMRTV